MEENIAILTYKQSYTISPKHFRPITLEDEEI